MRKLYKCSFGCFTHATNAGVDPKYSLYKYKIHVVKNLLQVLISQTLIYIKFNYLMTKFYQSMVSYFC